MEWIPARVTNPAPLHNRFEGDKNMASNRQSRRGGPRKGASARSLLAGALSRSKNPRGSKLRKGSPVAKAFMARLRAMRHDNPHKKGPGTLRDYLSKKGAELGKTGQRSNRNRKGKGKGAAATKTALTRVPNLGASGAIAANIRSKNAGMPKRRAQRALAARAKNPGFDLKRSLIESAVLLAGVFAASKIMPIIEKQIECITGLNDATRGYIKIAGALATIVGIDYAADKFGSQLGFDIRPAGYALATFMALKGFKGAGLITMDGSEGYSHMNGYDGYMNGTLGISGPVVVGGEVYGADMAGTMGLILPPGPENSMTGSIFSDAQLPFPAVAPHSVMQGGMGAPVPSFC